MRKLPRFLLASSLAAAVPAYAAARSPAPPTMPGPAYAAITPTLSSKVITLTGRDLSIDDIVQVARFGAKVELSPEARQRQADNYSLLLEAAAEGMAVYWFNRGAGSQRETVIFEGDALTPENKAKIETRQLASFRRGSAPGWGPEVSEEEVTRAMMVVRANAMTFNAPSPPLAQMLLDLLNKRVTPVVMARGTLGEGDLAPLSKVGATMIGVGDAYFQGRRMPAAQALAQAGLKPIQPFAADDNALTSSNAYTTGQAALAVYDAGHALQWADLIYAMDLNGMNSSITPLSVIVQCDRPEVWLNWDAARVIDMLKGSYLFDADKARIIQDPESLRASSIRQAAAWEEWNALREAVVFQANSSDHNPAVHVGLGPEDSWDLASAQMMKFYVKGGALSHGQHGYIVSNANWDPYPMANKLENFVIGLGNMDIAVSLRIDRFTNPFFTVISYKDVFPDLSHWGGGYTPVALQQELQSLMNPIAPSGAAIVSTVEDLESQTYIKVQRARQAVSITYDLLAHDLVEASFWMDVRKAQTPERQFGTAPTAVWNAFRKISPLRSPVDAVQTSAMLAATFLRDTPAESFYPAPLPQHGGESAFLSMCGVPATH